MTTNICHDCGCHEGAIHEMGCDMERCPICGDQLISCGCMYEYLGYKVDWNKPFCGLPQSVYKSGVSNAEQDKWQEHLSTIGRIPYIVYPNMCARCGCLWPEMFHVPDEEWDKYVEPAQRGKMLCLECYQEIKQLIDNVDNGEIDENPLS